jgi:hypothetical protein
VEHDIGDSLGGSPIPIGLLGAAAARGRGFVPQQLIRFSEDALPLCPYESGDTGFDPFGPLGDVP